MADDQHSVEVARISFRQGITVACIGLVGGVLTTLIGTSALQRGKTDMAAAALVGGSNATSLSYAALRDERDALRAKVQDIEKFRKERDAARARVAELEAIQANTTHGTNQGMAALRADLANAQRAAVEASSREQALKLSIVALTKERDDLKTTKTHPPMVHMWSRAATTTDEVCMSHAETTLKTVGITDIHYAGQGVYGEKESVLVVISCEDEVEMVFAASVDADTAEHWRDKVRDTFMAGLGKSQ